MDKSQDIILGLIFTVLGLAAAWGARSYSGAGGTYPLVLGATLALIGFAITVRAARQTTRHERQIVDAPTNFIFAVVGCIAYVALVVPLGFYTASILLLFLLPLLLGFRKPRYLAIMASAFIAIVWIVFTVVLEKPLPAEFWSSARMGGS